MPSSQYLPFGIGGGAGSPNTLSYASYAALTSLLTNGFQSGIANSTHINTLLRQVSVAAAGVAKFAADHGSADVLDDGSVANFKAALKSALDTLYTYDPAPLAPLYRQYRSTFSPTLSFGGSSAGMAYASRDFRVLRIQDFVFINGQLSLSTKGSGTGAVRIEGLPFAVSGNANATVSLDLFTGLDAAVNAIFINGTSACEFRIQTTTGHATPLPHDKVTNTSVIYLEGFYQTGAAWPS